MGRRPERQWSKGDERAGRQFSHFSPRGLCKHPQVSNILKRNTWLSPPLPPGSLGQVCLLSSTIKCFPQVRGWAGLFSAFYKRFGAPLSLGSSAVTSPSWDLGVKVDHVKMKFVLLKSCEWLSTLSPTQNLKPSASIHESTAGSLVTSKQGENSGPSQSLIAWQISTWKAVQHDHPLEKCILKPPWDITTYLLEWLKFKISAIPNSSKDAATKHSYP